MVCRFFREGPDQGGCNAGCIRQRLRVSVKGLAGAPDRRVRPLPGVAISHENVRAIENAAAAARPPMSVV